MEFRRQVPGASSSSSSSATASSSVKTGTRGNNDGTATTNDDPTHSWWESISKARSRIHLLSTLLLGDGHGPDSIYPNPIATLADSDRPARSLLSSSTAYIAVSSSLNTSTASGAGDDPICHWLYDTFLSSDSDLQLVVLCFIPLLVGIYLSRIHCLSSPPSSVAGFEAVLLALYSSETKSRAGKPILISIPDLSQPSLYHFPRVSNNKQNPSSAKFNAYSQSHSSQPTIGVVSPPLEPQTAIKSMKRATIVGVALDCYLKQISQMPDWSKLDFCKFAADWAGQDCPCKSEFDQKPETTEISDGIGTNEIEIEGNILQHMKNWEISDGTLGNVVGRGTRVPLPWELLQPVLRILGHCLMATSNSNDVKNAASIAVRCLYARSCHDLVPQAIVATRSLIQLEKRAREAAAITAAASNTMKSNANKPCKAKKPEIHLAYK